MKNNERKEIKPKSKPDPVDMTPPEQERIAEKLSISVPTQPLLRPTGLSRYFHQKVRLLFRDGNVMSGILQGRQFDYLNMLNVVETGKGEKLTADWCGVGLNSVSRIYPGNVKVEKINTKT